MLEELHDAAAAATKEVIKKAALAAGQLLVVGCSTSEVLGKRIGSSSSMEVAEALFSGIQSELKSKDIHLAVQCCEHLNRALVVEAAFLTVNGADNLVSAVPHVKAGGAFATVAYHNFRQPVLLDQIRADAGLDIGYTLIGMHLKRVAIPLRLETKRIGEAGLLAARVRPPYIGGSRAVYEESVSK